MSNKISVKGRKVVVIHPSSMGHPCFDIYCPRNEMPPELEDFGYRVEDCPVVKQLGTEDYVCSEDLAHPSMYNRKVLETIAALIRKGFDLEYVHLEFDDP